MAYEPGSNFVFPDGDVPPNRMSSRCTTPLAALGRGPLGGTSIKLTKIPIVLFYGDNIPASAVGRQRAATIWRVRLAMARLWADTVNRRGGDGGGVHLPELGIRGNTHFPFSDLNNLLIADLLSEFLRRKLVTSS